MLYKECSYEEFELAMEKMREWQRREILKIEITLRELKIMYSKMCADARHLACIHGSYAIGLLGSTERTCEKILQEINSRVEN